MIQYEKYPLRRLITVQEIVSADYVKGLHPSNQDHTHQDAWELCVCLSGQVHAVRDHRIIPLQAQEMLFMPPGVTHNFSVSQRDASAFLVSFTLSGGEYLRSLQEAIFPCSEAMLNVFHRMIDELEASFVQDMDLLHLFRFIPTADSPLGAEQMIGCCLEQVLILTLRQATMVQGQIVRSHRFKARIKEYLADQVSSYIQERLDQKLTAQSIAAHFHYSRAHLSAICKEATGLSIREMISYAKLQRAKTLLAAQEMTVAQISEALGFPSPQYFSHWFHQAAGCPPSRYTPAGQEDPEPPEPQSSIDLGGSL